MTAKLSTLDFRVQLDLLDDASLEGWYHRRYIIRATAADVGVSLSIICLLSTSSFVAQPSMDDSRSKYGSGMRPNFLREFYYLDIKSPGAGSLAD